MSGMSLVPDLLRITRQQRLQADAKLALDDANFEMTTGKVVDEIAATKGDPMKLFGLNRQLATLESREPLINFAKTRADMTAQVLGKASDALATIGQELRAFAETGDLESSKRIARGATIALRDVMSSLSASVGARMLFSGEKTGVAPLADMAVLIDDVKKAATPGATTQLIQSGAPGDTYVPAPFATPGAPTPAELVKRMNEQLDLYFRTPAEDVADPQVPAPPAARRFSGDVYLGGQKSPPMVELGDNDMLDYTVKADHKALKEVMRQLAVISVVESVPGMDRETQIETYKEAGLGLIQAKDKLTDLRADMGLSQRRIEDAAAGVKAERTTLELARNDLIGVDPYKAATRVQSLESQLQAIYTVTARTARLSFLDYMR